MTLRDVEVIELLADEPELLALADAVSATQPKIAPPRRRRFVFRGAILVAAAVAAIIAVLAAPQGHSGGVLGRALAAVGGGPIMHVVTEMPSGTVYLDLKTGRRTAAPVLREELWADRQGDRLHLVVSENGRLLGDLLLPQDLTHGTSGSPPDPAFLALWTGYRAALEDGSAELVGRGTIYGRPVYWLRFKPAPSSQPHPLTTTVAVDAHTYKPILYRTSVNGAHFDQRVLVAKAIPYRPADFKRRGPSLLSAEGVSSGGSSGSPSGFRSVRAPWLTAGPTVAGMKLRNVSQTSEYTTIAPGKRRSAHGIELLYRPVSHGGATSLSTTIDELLRPDNPQPWKGLRAGAIKIQQGSESSNEGGTHKTWTGYLVKDGVYLTVSTPKGQQALLEIARSLHRGS
jgi:hypothetical protein